MFESLLNKNKIRTKKNKIKIKIKIYCISNPFWWYQEKRAITSKSTNKNQQILASYYDINQKWTVQNYKKTKLGLSENERRIGSFHLRRKFLAIFEKKNHCVF